MTSLRGGVSPFGLRQPASRIKTAFFSYWSTTQRPVSTYLLQKLVANLATPAISIRRIMTARLLETDFSTSRSGPTGTRFGFGAATPLRFTSATSSADAGKTEQNCEPLCAFKLAEQCE